MTNIDGHKVMAMVYMNTTRSGLWYPQINLMQLSEIQHCPFLPMCFEGHHLYSQLSFQFWLEDTGWFLFPNLTKLANKLLIYEGVSHSSLLNFFVPSTFLRVFKSAATMSKLGLFPVELQWTYIHVLWRNPFTLTLNLFCGFVIFKAHPSERLTFIFDVDFNITLKLWSTTAHFSDQSTFTLS